MAGIPCRAELSDRLAQAWSQACHGGGRVVVLLGDAGAGKSTTLHWLAEHIGAPARAVSCHGTTQFSTAASFATALSIPDSATRAGVDFDAVTLGDAVCTALENSSTLALLVDDIHDADPSSRTLLNVALRRAVLSNVLVVVTGRRVQSAAAFAEGFDVFELDGLNPAEASATMTAATDSPIASRVLRRLLEVADGNPLALIHLPRALSREQLLGTQPLPKDLPLVGDLRMVLGRQLPRPGTAARELIDLASVSADGPWTALAELCPNAETALEDLEDLGLANLRNGRLSLHHPLLRSAAIETMSSRRWRQLNLALAASPSLPEGTRLEHRAYGTIGPDEDLVDLIVDAAQLMRVRGGTDAAARLLDRAVDLTGDDGRRGWLSIQAAELLSTAGDADGARNRLEAVLGDPTSRNLHVAATLTLATLEALNGAPATAWQRLLECLAIASPSEIGKVHARMAIPLGMLGLVGQIVDSAEAAVEHSKPDSPEADVARVILAHAASAQDEARAQQLVDELLVDLDLVATVHHDPMVGLHIGRALSIAERYGDATSALTDLGSRSRGEGAQSSLAMTIGALGETYVRTSRFDEALVCLDDAIALSLSTGQRAFAPFWLSLRGRVRAIRGDDDASAADFTLGFAISDEQSTFGARYFLLANAGLAAMTAQRYDAAVGHLAECWAFELAGGLLAPQLARWHADFVEAQVAAGRRTDAEPVVAHLADVAATPGASRWTTATAQRAQAALVADTDRGLALALLDDAIATYDAEVDCFDRARALLLKANLAETREDRQLARNEALFAFRRLGAAPWAARLVASDVPKESAGLTESEGRILAEVAKGLTNKQIAKNLHVSVKTVANHLYHVYQKLGVSSRTEAARFVLLEGRGRS